MIIPPEDIEERTRFIFGVKNLDVENEATNHVVDTKGTERGFSIGEGVVPMKGDVVLRVSITN